ncbi:hypothetical protein ACJH6J_23980 [Mycobacterium sp. SMC-18]|uniref:hypothetical protein n=1 Tax=Mycobacterium sp. SMC-21 TaxID=3381632 RepID=UPI0038770FE7
MINRDIALMVAWLSCPVIADTTANSDKSKSLDVGSVIQRTSIEVESRPSPKDATTVGAGSL